MLPECLLRRSYDPSDLLARFSPMLRHPNKQLVFDLACAPGARHAGPIEVTRWAATGLPQAVELAATEIIALPGYYDYAPPTAGVWHVNFSDPQLFVAYGSPLLAQDELQAAEHPLLGSIRESLLAEGQPALTEESGQPTPVLVAGAERRCAIATEPDLDAGRPFGLYGNQFARAPEEVVRAAVKVYATPARTNLIAMSAPGGGRGAYFRRDLERILVTAYTAFSAAVSESRRIWPPTPTEIRTGFWGCGAFGGNRRVMTLLQLLAARLARVDRLRFHAADDAGVADFRAGAADLERVLGQPGAPLSDLIERIADLDHEWGVSNGT